MANDEGLVAFLETQPGYSNITEIEGRGTCCVGRFIFTSGVLFGLNRVGYEGRYCFDTVANASLFLESWDGTEGTKPVIGEDGCTALKD